MSCLKMEKLSTNLLKFTLHIQAHTDIQWDPYVGIDVAFHQHQTGAHLISIHHIPSLPIPVRSLQNAPYVVETWKTWKEQKVKRKCIGLMCLCSVNVVHMQHTHTIKHTIHPQFPQFHYRMDLNGGRLKHSIAFYCSIWMRMRYNFKRCPRTFFTRTL